MPSQNCVWREQRTDFFKPFPTEDLAFDCQPLALVVAEQDSLFAELLFEHFVLGQKVCFG